MGLVAPPAPEFSHLWTDPESLALESPPSVLSMNWLIPGWMECEDVTLWVGDPGVGKSLVLVALGLALSSGQKLLDYWPHPNPEEPFKVVFLDLENRSRVLKRRIIRICGGLGLDYKTLCHPRIGSFIPLSLRGQAILEDDVVPQTVKVLRDLSPDLIILDTLMSSSDQSDMTPAAGIRFIKKIYAINRQLEKNGREPSWWVIHHTKKPSDSLFEDAKEGRVGDLHQAMGGGVVGASDALVMVQEDTNGVIITNPKQRHKKDKSRLYLYLDELEDENESLYLSLSPKIPLSEHDVKVWLEVERWLKSQSSHAAPRPAIIEQIRSGLSSKNAAKQASFICGRFENNELLVDKGQLKTGERGRPAKMLGLPE